MKNYRRQKGFTLIETIVALGVFGVASAAIANGFIMQMRTNNQNTQRGESIAAAQFILDQQRVIDPTSMPSAGTSAAQNVTVGSHTYSVTITYCAVPAYCVSPNVRHLRVNVSYQTVLRYSVDTVYAQLR